VTHYVKVSLTVIVIMAVVFRVPALRQVVTGA